MNEKWYKKNRIIGMWYTGWKIVHLPWYSSTMTSAIVRSDLVYCVDKITTPNDKSGPLTVFGDRESAESFMKNQQNLMGWKYEILNVVYKKSSEMSVRFYKNGVTTHLKHPTPPNTDFADLVIAIQ